jgi:hypothetical protein
MLGLQWAIFLTVISLIRSLKIRMRYLKLDKISTNEQADQVKYNLAYKIGV